MDLKRLLLWFAPFVLCCCMSQSDKSVSLVDDLNLKSYNLRYTDVDSSLFYAREALKFSEHYPDGKAEALNNIAYVAYQQMRFDLGKHLLEHNYQSSRNQLELLCSDVIAMKIAQRLGDGKLFFDKRLRALRRIKRIEEAKAMLTDHQLQRFLYAETELHIVSSTYYFYLGQDSASVAEMMEIGKDLKLENDITQWLYCQYMMGSGGMVSGTDEDIRLQEFDYLFRTFTISKANRILYFEANALQSLAYCLNDSVNVVLVGQKRKDAYTYLMSQYRSPLQMAVVATSIFRQYKDLFQTACGHRTMGEILFSKGEYKEALCQFLYALSLAREQKYRSSGSVVPWLAGMHEKLSMTYAALDDTASSQYHRTRFLSLLDSSRQNKELDSRMDDLKSELSFIRTELVILILLIVFVASLAVVYARRVNRRTKAHLHDVVNIRHSQSFLQASCVIKEMSRQYEENLELLTDECRMLQMKISENLRKGIERRAKVSLVYSIVPYLDRMLAESRRMKDDGHVDKTRLEYISELADEIQKVNERLTDWIIIEQGQLRLHISTFPLQNVLDIISMASNSFEKNGLQFYVAKTECIVKADQTLTLFMINTLVDNAGKFTPKGGRVSVDVQEKLSYVEIAIEDTGLGLSPEDVDTLNNSKVYDSKKIGSGQSSEIKERKGFGFGIMNCKGIIGKYRKQSSLFSVCEFGVESKIGEGSRFWFRLPRVVSILVFCMFASFATANTTAVSLRRVDEYNAKAVSALAEHNWDEYNYYNNEALRLHYLYSQDTTLSHYCQQMEKAKSDSVVLFCLLIIFSIIAVVLFYLVFLRDRLRRKSMLLRLRSELDNVSAAISNNPLHVSLQFLRERCMAIAAGKEDLEILVNSYFSDFGTSLDALRKVGESISNTEDLKSKLSIESGNLYVRNQILDNALSTIKHETMYYPARAQQLVRLFLAEGAQEGQLQELLDILTYYRQLYMLLYRQADMQLDHKAFRVSRMPLEHLSSYVESLIVQYNSRYKTEVSFCTEASNTEVSCDKMLVEELLSCIILPNIQHCSCIDLSFSVQENNASIRMHFIGVRIDEDRLLSLFSPTTDEVSYLIAKQIIREHDSYYHHPGLRLTAQAEEDGFSIIFTLVHK